MSDQRQTLKDHIVGLRHVGYIVPDLKAATDTFEKIYGISDGDISIIPPYDTDAPTRFAFISVGNVEFELIEPLSDDFKKQLLASPSGGGGINHVAYDVTDIEGALSLLEAKGITPGHVTPDGIIDLGNKKMLYLDPATTDGFLIELIETKQETP